MDDVVARSLARWPDVPAVAGWLRLDRRGRWLLRDPASAVFGPIGNAALNAFIARNYAPDAAGRWFFQNGPQRVYVALDYAPLVVRMEGAAYRDHLGRAVRPSGAFVDDEGAVLLASGATVALLDDRDLYAFAEREGERIDALPRIARADVARRFGFEPAPTA